MSCFRTLLMQTALPVGTSVYVSSTGSRAMQAMPQGALAYFNCGPESGASQPHKHVQVGASHLATAALSTTCHWQQGHMMQVVPLPLADDPAVIPSPIGILMDESWQANERKEGDIASVQQLPYQNYFSKLSSRYK